MKPTKPTKPAKPARTRATAEDPMRLLPVLLALLLLACGGDKGEVCDDGADNDSNGLIDCADEACGAGKACGAYGLTCSADKTCTACSGNGGRAEAAETVCGDGADNDCDGLADCADPDCQPNGTELGRSCDALGFTCGPPDAGGVALCDRCADGRPSAAGCGAAPGQEALGYLRFVGAEHAVLGATGSGYREKSTLTFEAIGEDGEPYPAGLRVRFTHEAQGGSYVGPRPSCTPGTPSLCTAEGVTDEEGRARVVLTSGRRFALVSVKAEATLGSVVRSVVASGLAVVGAKANGAHLSLDCKPYNVPAFTVHDCLYSRYAEHEPVCTVSLADRHGIVLGVPTAVSFQSEAANAPAPVLTPAFEIGSADAALGYARTPLHVYGYPIPRDVAPWAGEASHQASWHCGAKTGNPRDGFVTVVAMVAGEEGFVDRDLNGRWDAGEPFVDLGEPYVDADDSGAWEQGEWWLDANEDGAYTGPNGRWDASTVLWTQTRVVYTGHPSPQATRFFDLGSGPPPAPATLTPFEVFMGPPPTGQVLGVYVADENLNPMSSFTTFGVAAQHGNVSASLRGPDHTADSIGTLGQFRLLYCDRPSSPTACSSGTAAEACRTSPCYVVPEVGRCAGGACPGFSLGNYGEVAVTCAEPGFDVVDLSVTIDEITSLFPTSGFCFP